MEFFYQMYRISLLVGLVRIKICEDLKGMVNAIGGSKVVEVYLVSTTSTFSLPWDSPTMKGMSSIIITEILESDTIREPRSETVIQPERTEELRHEGEGERQTDVGEDIRPDEVLIKSDYEMDEENGPQAEPTVDNNVNIDISFGDLYEGSGCNSDTDYGDLDVLDNLNSE
ncbi:hypothetical protein Fot_22049 [Forsythia ovata]|uniref:Uncharacterized protein n=1 Tax=Forsythia ovata TaxID=205694 RepID=A0ABD1UXM0_9LAMI